ncbi:hypothetical protein J2Z75_002417 [Rhizobium herbae]|uniref:Uncharacterized protein n=1 Tax=Rhizobium herbae TaxID=508661 RepID=A0ABS4ELV4_9HYPH|nr:hypothetical protein [Rhizobium herbae]
MVPRRRRRISSRISRARWVSISSGTFTWSPKSGPAFCWRLEGRGQGARLAVSGRLSVSNGLSLDLGWLDRFPRLKLDGLSDFKS